MRVRGGKRELAGLAWPLAVGLLSMTLMGTVDTLLMGRVSTAAQAGVGLGTTLSFFFISFALGLLGGPQSVVAAAHGAGDKERMRVAGSAGALLGLGLGLASTGVLALLYRPLLGWVVNDAAVLQSASKYIRVVLLGVPLKLTAFGLAAAIQGMGETRARMRVTLQANLLNVLLDLLLIFGWGPIPALAEIGAAWASVISSWVFAALFAVRYLRLLGRLRRPTAEVLLSSLRLGLPTGAERMLSMFTFTTVCLVLARVGRAHLAASEIVINVVSISFLPGFGIAEAGGILVGRYLGAGRRETAAATLRSARRVAFWVMGACAVLFALAGYQIGGVFSRDPQVVLLVTELLLFAAAFQLFDALGMVHICALRAAGDTRFALLATVGCSWGLTLPLTLLLGLHLGWGAPGAYLGLTLEIAALALITGLRSRGIASGRVGRLDLLLGNGKGAGREDSR